MCIVSHLYTALRLAGDKSRPLWCILVAIPIPILEPEISAPRRCTEPMVSFRCGDRVDELDVFWGEIHHFEVGFDSYPSDWSSVSLTRWSDRLWQDHYTPIDLPRDQDCRY